MTVDDPRMTLWDPGNAGTAEHPVVPIAADRPGLAEQLCMAAQDIGICDFVQLTPGPDHDSLPWLLSVGKQIDESLSQRRFRADAALKPRPTPWPIPWILVAAYAGGPPSPVELTEFHAGIGRLALAHAPAVRLNAILVEPTCHHRVTPSAGVRDIVKTARTIIALPAILGQVLRLRSDLLAEP